MIVAWFFSLIDGLVVDTIAHLPPWTYSLDPVTNWFTYMTMYLYTLDWLVPFKDGVLPLTSLTFTVVVTFTAIKSAVFVANLLRGSGA